MTTADLKEILETAREILETNREIVTPELLSAIKKFLQSISSEEIKVMSADVSAADIPLYVKILLKIVEIEEKLVVGTLTDRILNGITKLENRPVVFRLLATIL